MTKTLRLRQSKNLLLLVQQLQADHRVFNIVYGVPAAWSIGWQISTVVKTTLSGLPVLLLTFPNFIQGSDSTCRDLAHLALLYDLFIPLFHL